MPEIKMIATDLDGTFYGEMYDIPEENLRAVKAAQEAGILVCACSARLWAIGHLMAQKALMRGWGVFNNGAAVADVDTGKIAYHRGIAPDKYRALIEAAATFGVPIHSWNHDFIGMYGPTMGENGRRSMSHPSDPSIRCDVRVFDSLDDMDRGNRDTAQKIMINMDYRRMPEVIEKMARVCEVEVTSSISFMIEVTMPGVTKGEGLRRLAALYNMDPKNIMAIGDNFNDIGMLEFAGTRVAVGNAREDLKKVAQHVVASNMDAGFAEAVYSIALK